jgi:hypothetical protein
MTQAMTVAKAPATIRDLPCGTMLPARSLVVPRAPALIGRILFTLGACTRSCFVPRYRSVVWTEA